MNRPIRQYGAGAAWYSGNHSNRSDYRANVATAGNVLAYKRYTTDGTSTPLYTAYYYDVKGQVTKTVQSNLLNGYEVTTTGYTFTGQPQTVTHTHTASGKSSVTETYTYTYDAEDRLIQVRHKLGSAQVTLATCTYDSLGRMQTKSPHGNATNELTYSYNVRDWLTGITGTRFTQHLDYSTCYNGNISSMTWKSGNETTTRGYQFTYDDLSRMLSATYGEGTDINLNVNRFTEKVTGYDKNGNIKGLQRYGQTSASAYGLIDNLTYTLDGNRPTRVDDAVSTAAYNNGFEFKDAVKQANEYAYDANGNLTKDLNRNITEIQYNFLNLPSEVEFSDGSTITYTYAADGTKLRVVHTIGGTTTTTDYCGNVIYENGVRKYLLTGEGYVTLADNKYHYYLKDHQGNNRVVVDQSGTVEETNHYYPFGGVFASTASVQPYKYNGKEFDLKKGLNWYDYGARMYDPALGRFTTVDPMAEDYNAISAYAYCLNNPVRYVDPFGMQSDDTIIDGGSIPEIIINGSRVAPPISGFWGNLQYLLFGRSMELPVYGIDMQGNPTGTIIGSLRFDINKGGYIKGLTPQSGIAPLPGLNKSSIIKDIWSKTKTLSSVENAFNHWLKHAKDFPQFKNAKQYVEGAKSFLHNPPIGTLTKIRENGDILRYNPVSNTFGVMDANGIPKTMFKPNDGMKYWLNQ